MLDIIGFMKKRKKKRENSLREVGRLLFSPIWGTGLSEVFQLSYFLAQQDSPGSFCIYLAPIL